MAAGVHESRVDRAESFSGRTVALLGILDDAQGIHVEAKGHHRAFAAAQDSHDARKSILQPRGKLRVCPLLQCARILSVQFFLTRHTHTGLILADLSAHQDFVTEFGQISGDPGGRAHFKPACLCVLVKISAALNHLIAQFFRLFYNFIIYHHFFLNIYPKIWIPSSRSFLYCATSEGDA